jgi:nitroreductase
MTSVPVSATPSATRSAASAPTPVRDAPAVLDALLSRRSGWPLAAPAPSDDELDRILDTALRAPDHGDLRPWRLVVVRGAARDALGEAFVKAAVGRGEDAASAERFRRKAMAAPVIVALGAKVVEGHKIPVEEQLLTVGASAMNMLNAIHALGYGGFWSTGANGHDPRVAAALGLHAPDRLLGFLYIGTAQQPSTTAPRPDRRDHVREWSGPAA